MKDEVRPCDKSCSQYGMTCSTNPKDIKPICNAGNEYITSDKCMHGLRPGNALQHLAESMEEAFQGRIYQDRRNKHHYRIECFQNPPVMGTVIGYDVNHMERVKFSLEDLRNMEEVRAKP